MEVGKDLGDGSSIESEDDADDTPEIMALKVLSPL